MARINIEESLFKKAEWSRLIFHFNGDREKALGALYFAWSVAQEYWAPHKNLIPFDVWESQLLNDALIQVGFAERRDQGIYMKGSEKQFAWLIQRHVAGKKGGRPKDLQRVPSITDRFDLKPIASKSNRLEPSSSYSFSNTLEQTSSLRSDVSTELEFPASVVEKLRPLPEFEEFGDFIDGKALTSIQESWWNLYSGDLEFFRREFLKMKVWVQTNPRKCPRSARGWTRFIAGWLERGWSGHAKRIQSYPLYGPLNAPKLETWKGE